MSIESLKSELPDYAKDIRINLSNVLTEQGAPGLNPQQILGIALACAYAVRDPRIIAAVQQEAQTTLPEEAQQAARTAAVIMAMNNVYYRFIHLVHDPELSKLPANLRMQAMLKPGVSKVDFALYTLAVSSINGCGMCMEAHVREALEGGITKLGIQSVVRIAAVIHATAQALT